ncbi:hypothetical protein GW7_17549 [Heterocephalus glaber]|uniref:Uncharacterized protein C16orf46 homolog n=1 Tax=Heterocephalus glaber TaxID=10181 RepID=G5B1X6_HETGA|nr:uncharacterized protein C16orf46 homolog [Heterocephalus glaber]EHB03287.1 hypothetical protein GW7_17549 [Heterocephalus glaber]
MDLCQESETDLENNEIQSPEETELTFTCAGERSEKNHIYCLLDISDLTLEEDAGANEFAIGTGWEEAVQGWGKTSPTACIWPRKKLKKARGCASASSSCLLCASLSPGSPEARPPTWPRKVEAGAEVGLEGSQGSQGPNTAPREASRICFPHDVPEGKKSLRMKEFIWRLEDWAIPGVRGAAAERAPTAPTVSDSLSSKAHLVLPPLRASAQSRLSKNLFCQSEEEAPSVDKEEGVDGKGEQEPLELAGHLPLGDARPGPGPAPAARSLLAHAERCCLSWSLLPERSPGSLPYFATVQPLQKRGMQSYRAKLKARGLGLPRNSQKLAFPEARRENRPPVLETDVLPRSLLPALTVSRVVIPVSTHRVL